MAEARERAEWNRAACLMCVIVNVNIDSKKTTPFTPADFNPYSEESAKRKRVEDTNARAKQLIDQAVERQSRGK